MNHLIIIYLSLLSIQTLRTHTFETSFYLSNEKPLNQKTEFNNLKASVVCNRTSLSANVKFREPFFGIIYAIGFASECRSYGNGSKVVNFITKTDGCGVRSIDNQSIYNEYELVLYVQNDRNIQQASDEKIEVKCAPQELLLTGVVGNLRNQLSSKFNGKSLYGGSDIEVHQMRSHNFTLSDITDSLECRMEVMKGRIPFLKPINGFVDLGQDVTVLIKIKQIADIDSMISRCFAHDGSHLMKQELTNSDGCSVDTNIFPNFQLMNPNPASDSNVYYTTFPAFKFPDKTNLNIQCTVIICNTTCPQIRCDNTRVLNLPLHRIKRLSNSPNDNNSIIIEKKLTLSNNNDNNHNNDSNSYDLVLSEIGISNSLGVKNGDSIHNEDNSIKNINSTERMYINKLESCLTSQTLQTVGVLIIFVLLCALTITCYCGIKVQELNHKLSNNKYNKYWSQPFTYGPQDLPTFSYRPMPDLTI